MAQAPADIQKQPRAAIGGGGELAPSEAETAAMAEALIAEMKPAATSSGAGNGEAQSELESQLDDLVAQAQEAIAATEGRSSAAGVEQEPPAEETDGEFLSPEQMVDQGQQLANDLQALLDEAAQADDTAEENAAPQVARLDAQLAAQADDAVAGEFETVNDVLAAHAAPTPGAKIPHALHAAAMVDIAAPSADDEIGGDFHPPQDVGVTTPPPPQPQLPPQPPPNASLGASAADVARELDSQPERAPADKAQSRKRNRLAGLVRIAGAVAAANPLPRLCYTLNLALRPLAPEWRNVIGLIGILSLFNGLVFCALGLARRFFAE